MAIKPSPAALNRVDEAIDAARGIADEALDHVDVPMQAQQEAIADAANVDSITAIIQAIGRDMNTEKAKLAVALLNVTAFAVGLQGRSAWNTRDFMSFGVALAALAQIDNSDPARNGDEYAPRRAPRGGVVDMNALERAARG